MPAFYTLLGKNLSPIRRSNKFLTATHAML
jgi:hypothetical protein